MEKIIAIIIFGLILLTCLSYLVNLYNRLIMLKNNIEKSYANIDVLLKQRADEIPNLVQVVKGYKNYESELLERLTRLRSEYLNARNVENKVQTNNEIEKTLKSFIVIAENYPDLKANSSFLKLQVRISEIENHIADRREFYNESVTMYNIGIAEFPSLFFAKMMRYKKMSLLQITEEEKKYDGIQF